MTDHDHPPPTTRQLSTAQLYAIECSNLRVQLAQTQLALAEAQQRIVRLELEAETGLDFAKVQVRPNGIVEPLEPLGARTVPLNGEAAHAAS